MYLLISKKNIIMKKIKILYISELLNDLVVL